MTKTLTILVVDDDADDCEFFLEAITEIDSSSRCLIANDGEDALKKLRGEIRPLPDLIFLDLNMYRMDGKSCLIELKKDMHLKNIPVIILTTSSSQREIDDTKMLGASYYMTKPPEYQKLRDEIAFVITQNWLGYSGSTS